MRVLRVDASARVHGSYSRQLADDFINCLISENAGVCVDLIDLAVDAPSHFGGLQTSAIYAAPGEFTPAMHVAMALSDRFVRQAMDADAWVISTPMYNFGIPSTLKAFFDHVSRPGLTFISDETGVRGLLGEKRVAVLTSAGGAYEPGDIFEGLDCMTPHLRAIFGFLGIKDITFIHARPTMIGEPAVTARAFRLARDLSVTTAQKWLQSGGGSA